MTERDESLHVVFGATGAIGSTVVTELVHAGRDVRAVSRGGQAPDAARGVAADASDPAQAARAAAGASVLYHCASPPYTQWPELFPPLTRSILDAAESSGAKLVYADNLYAYGPVDGPLREDLPAAAPGPKGQIRVEMAAQLLAAGARGSLSMTVPTPCRSNNRAHSRRYGVVTCQKAGRWKRARIGFLRAGAAYAVQ